MKTWFPLNNFPGYEITAGGRVRCAKTKKVKKQSLSDGGYFRVSITKDSKESTMRVHRLVAETFLPNPDNKPYVNHKDGNKQNNKRSNLEWCSQKENVNHAIDTGLFPTKKVVAICLTTNKRTTFISISECARAIKTSAGHIGDVLQGRRKTAKKHKFEYA